MTENTNNPPGVPQWVAGGAPGTPAEQQRQAEQQWLAARQGDAVPGAPAPGGKSKSSDGKPSGLILAGAGSLLAVLAFLGGTAVGHAWGSGGATQQTQFPGGGRFPQGQLPNGQVPGGQQPGQQAPGTVPSTPPTTGTDPNQVPQQTQPSTGTQSPGVPGQGYGRRVPGQGPRGGQQSPGQQVPGQPDQTTNTPAKPA